MSRLEDHQNVSFSFIPRADAVAYIKGLPQKLEKDADGCVHITLESGEGVFIEDRAEYLNGSEKQNTFYYLRNVRKSAFYAALFRRAPTR